MMTTLFLSQTLASLPKCCLKTPMVPGPHTSWVMRISVSTQMLSPGTTLSLPACRARILSVMVIAGITKASVRKERGCISFNSGESAKSVSRHGNIFAQIDVLNRVQKSGPVLERFLKRLAPRNQAHAAGALVDDGRRDSFGQVARSL